MLKVKSRHRDAAPPVHCTAAAFACAACVFSSQQWVCLASLIHMTGVHVAEFLTCPLLSWARWELQTPHSVFLQPHSYFIFFFAIHVISVDSIAKLMINWVNSTSSSFSPHFPQKRAKKLEGETIYIRHSNLMLEVCIFSLQISVLAVCCHVFLPASVTVDIHFALTSVFLNFSSCFQLNPKGMACTIYLSDSHASSVISLWNCLCHFIYNFYEIYTTGEGLFFPL